VKERQRLALLDVAQVVDRFAWVSGIPQADLRAQVLGQCTSFRPTGEQPVAIDKDAFVARACVEISRIFLDEKYHFLERSPNGNRALHWLGGFLDQEATKRAVRIL
jgi:hypothetical protein